MKKSLFALLVVIGILLMPMYCMADNDFGLEIVSGKYYGEEYGFDKFDLVVKNNTDININNIGVTADILDSNENILGQAYLGGTSSVKPGQSITMEAYADHYEGAVKAIANYGYYNDSNNNYYDGYFYDSLEVVFDTSVESVADNEGEKNKSDSEDIDTLKKRIEELESENEELKNHSSENTNIDLESMSVDELKELKASIDNYLEVDTQNDENTDTEDDSNSSEYYDVAKAYWADCENLSDINNYKVIWVKKYSQNVFSKEIYICRTILDENGENDGIKVTIYDAKMGNRKTVSEAKFLKDKAKENEIAEEIDWSKVVEFSLQEGDDIEPIPEDSQISYEEASGGKGSSNKKETTTETEATVSQESKNASIDENSGDVNIGNISIKTINDFSLHSDTIFGETIEDVKAKERKAGFSPEDGESTGSHDRVFVSGMFAGIPNSSLRYDFYGSDGLYEICYMFGAEIGGQQSNYDAQEKDFFNITEELTKKYGEPLNNGHENEMLFMLINYKNDPSATGWTDMSNKLNVFSREDLKLYHYNQWLIKVNDYYVLIDHYLRGVYFSASSKWSYGHELRYIYMDEETVLAEIQETIESQEKTAASINDDL